MPKINTPGSGPGITEGLDCEAVIATVHSGDGSRYVLHVQPHNDTLTMLDKNGVTVSQLPPGGINWSQSIKEFVDTTSHKPNMMGRWVTKVTLNAWPLDPRDEAVEVVVDLQADPMGISTFHWTQVNGLIAEHLPRAAIVGGVVSGTSTASRQAQATTAPTNAPAAAAAVTPLDMEVMWAADVAGNPRVYYCKTVTMLDDPATGATKTMRDIDLFRVLYEWNRKNPARPLHVILAGPPGGGKSTVIRVALGSNVKSLAFSDALEEWRLFGKTDYGTDAQGNFYQKFVMGQFLEAFTHIHDDNCPDPCGAAVFVAEEFNLAPPSLLPLLHPALDGTGSIEYEGVVYIQSPDFMFVGTANLDTIGSIVTDPFWSRNGFVVEWEPSSDPARRMGLWEPLCDVMDNLVEKRRNGHTTLAIPAMRDLLAADSTHKLFGEAQAWVTFLSRVNPKGDQAASSIDWLAEVRIRAGDAIADYIEANTFEGRQVIR